jgi:excisionase family DNA binding protein
MKTESSNNRNGAPAESHQRETRLAFAPIAMRTGAAAHYTGLSRRTIFKLASRGAVAVVRVSPKCLLFKRADLDAFLARRRVAAVGEGGQS